MFDNIVWVVPAPELFNPVSIDMKAPVLFALVPVTELAQFHNPLIVTSRDISKNTWTTDKDWKHNNA